MRRGGDARPFGPLVVVTGQLGRGPGAGDGVGALRGLGEDVGQVGGGAAGQGDQGVRAVLGAGYHGQPGGHGAALRDVIGDRVAQLSILIRVEQEVSVGPAALPGGRVSVQRAAHDQPPAGDGVDAEKVAVGQGPAGLARLDSVVVAGADDQVARAGRGAVGDGYRGAGPDQTEAHQVVADPAGQLAAQGVVGGHQQGVRAVQGQRDVGGRGGVHHLFRLAAVDAALLVVLSQDADVAGAEAQAGGLFPGGAESDGFSELDVAEGVGEQGHAAAVFHRLQLLGIAGQDDLGAGRGCLGDDVGQVGGGDHGGRADQDQVAGLELDGAAGAAQAGQVAQELRGVVGDRDPGGQGVAG